MQICGDCLTYPSLDQRAHVQNGRCDSCIERLAKALAKRKAQREAARAHQTQAPVYELQEAYLDIHGKVC